MQFQINNNIKNKKIFSKNKSRLFVSFENNIYKGSFEITT